MFVLISIELNQVHTISLSLSHPFSVTHIRIFLFVKATCKSTPLRGGCEDQDIVIDALHDADPETHNMPLKNIPEKDKVIDNSCQCDAEAEAYTAS